MKSQQGVLQARRRGNWSKEAGKKADSACCVGGAMQAVWQVP